MMKLQAPMAKSSEWMPRGAARCRPGSARPPASGAQTSHRVSQLSISISHSPMLQQPHTNATAMMIFSRGRRGLSALTPLLFLVFLLLAGPVTASIGDRLPEFKACVEVRCQPLSRSLLCLPHATRHPFD